MRDGGKGEKRGEGDRGQNMLYSFVLTSISTNFVTLIYQDFFLRKTQLGIHFSKMHLGPPFLK